ncbi:mammalian cell entry protein [Mycolicibacterium fortuitum]|uniref:Mammalian cell entry protein n=1 Tax=Mycolicibacterium fortuitum TaxID=1766 RepID=A0ABD6QIZ3_MYCFO|nr:MlaD family protein [Mycolicibacterium fortuitum]OMC39563.1 mammalian cell entry protein [Mycolicibacterium fortuitum]
MSGNFGALWRFGIALVVSVLLLIVISNVITQPVAGETQGLSAEFSDVSGLREGADVRVRGVQVGKVTSIGLKRSEGRTVSRVEFTLQREYAIVPASRLAVRFQALTGLRYIDVTGAARAPAGADSMNDIPITMTVPSFDVTVLFNGLQPVLATLDPNEINTFTDNVATFLAGDGSGLGPMLDSIKRLTGLVSDREAVIATILQNLKRVAEGVRGNSDALPKILEQVKLPIESGMTVLDEFRKSQIYGPEFTGEFNRLLSAMGLNDGWDPETAFDKAVTNLYNEMDAIKRIPVVWENLPEPPVAGMPAPCSKGRAELPLPMDVLLNGRKVVVCNQ